MKRVSKKIKITNSWGIHYRVSYFILEYIKQYNIKEFIIECEGLKETRNPKTYHDFKDMYSNKEILLTIEADKCEEAMNKISLLLENFKCERDI